MKNYPNFTEYVSGKGKLVEKPPVETVPDYKGPKKTKPDKMGKWPVAVDSSEKQKNCCEPKPYVGVGTDPGQPGYPNGLGDEGDKKLKYSPNTTGVSKEGGTKKGTFPTTESILQDTKGMSTSEFAYYMGERTVRSGIELEAVKYIASNPITQHALIRELKNNGNIESFIQLLVQTPGIKNILEGVGPPMHKGLRHDDEDMSAPTNRPPKDGGEMDAHSLGVNMDDEEDEDFDDEDMDMEDEEDEDFDDMDDDDEDMDMDMDFDDDEEPDFDDDDDEDDDEEDEDDDELGGYKNHPDEYKDEITFDDDEHVGNMKKMVDRMRKF